MGAYLSTSGPISSTNAAGSAMGGVYDIPSVFVEVRGVFTNTTPIDAFKGGDFGALLTSNQVGTDALGRPVYQGQIFNPATTRLVNGVPVRDPYPGNRIPGNDPLRSQVAADISPSESSAPKTNAKGCFRSCGSTSRIMPCVPGLGF